MAEVSPSRPARRAARPKVIVEESEDELSFNAKDDEEEFTPAAKRSSPRKSSRRQTTANVETSPRKNNRGRRAKTGEGIEPSEIFDPEASTMASQPSSPSKKSSPRKRKSATTSRTSHRPLIIPDMPPLPTPAPSTSPEP